MIDIEQLKALDRAATPRWHKACTDLGTLVIIPRLPPFEGRQVAIFDEHEADLDLAIAMRSALPDLFALLEEARRLVSMLRCDMECIPDDAADHTGHWSDCATVQARAFLSKFETKREG